MRCGNIFCCNLGVFDVTTWAERCRKYRNPLIAEGESVSPMTKNVKNIFKLTISVINDCRKKIGGNVYAEI
jgi:hypothetical protein